MILLLLAVISIQLFLFLMLRAIKQNTDDTMTKLDVWFKAYESHWAAKPKDPSK